MIKLIRGIAVNLLRRLFHINKFDNNSYINYLRKTGVEIGNNTVFFSPGTQRIDTTRPCLLEIGNNCKITAGVTILAHDYSYSVLRVAYGDLIGECGKTKIGNNVFIGINAIILSGVSIGDNVIVGAGSVVTKDVSPNTVVGGNPAHFIMSLQTFYENRKRREDIEAKLLAREIYKKEGRQPTIEEMGAFFPLFLPRDEKLLLLHNVRINLSGDSANNLVEWFIKSEPVYRSFEHFLECALKDY